MRQRKALLESLIAESDLNIASFGHGAGKILGDVFKDPGVMVVADLCDPLLAPSEANSIFAVLLEYFRRHVPTSKLVLLDEAHKYLGDAPGQGGLSAALLNAVRLMRHEALRIAISTQSPRSLTPELLELVTVAAMHRFHSFDWHQYLQAKLPLPADAFEHIQELPQGHALVFAVKHALAGCRGLNLLPLHVRPRITSDRGASRTNS